MRRPRVLRLGAALAVAAAAPAQALALPPDWAQRDLEGRWVAYQRDLDGHQADAERRQKWATALVAAGEFEFLEWIATYGGWTPAGSALAKAGAPQWMRVALWNLRAADSHNRDTARDALLKQPGAARAWFEKYPLAQRRGAELYGKLREFAAGDAGAQLPPLDGMAHLMRFLDVPAQLAEFGDRLRAERGVVYRHQVVRALQALPIWNELEPQHLAKVVALTRHPDAELRRQTYLAITALPPVLVPWQALWPATQQGAADERRLALLACSYSPHPRVWFELHRIATDAGAVTRDVACSRIGDVGDGYSLELLQRLLAPRPGDEVLQRALQRLRTAIGRQPFDAETAKAPLLRALWATATGAPEAADYGAWLEARCAAASPALRRALAERLPELAADPALLPDERQTLAAALPEWRARLRGGQ